MIGRNAPRYVALGDSVSIALYPETDAYERLGRSIAGLSAPELLVRNEDSLWTEFQSRDLTSILPDIAFENLSVDGGTMDTVLGYQLGRLQALGADIVTLTIGGNDILEMLRSVPAGLIPAGVAELSWRYRETVDRIRHIVPDAIVVLTTVYDPTDGTGNLGDGHLLPIQLLEPLNDTIRGVATSDPHLLLADAHKHFMGRGISAPSEHRWYWTGSIIEPSMEGASEVRRLRLTALESTGMFGLQTEDTSRHPSGDV